jgi:predicted nucleic acid-binding protein
MKLAIIDTNIASFLLGNKLERELYREELVGRRVEVSFQTVAELLYGAEAAGWGAARRNTLRAFVRSLRVVPYDYELAKAWARVLAESERRGRALTTTDAWVAATAIARRAPLVAHDRDFVDLKIKGLDVICHA